MTNRKSNYTYTEEQLSEQLKAYPHLVQDCLEAIQQIHDSQSENTQASVCLTLRSMDRYNDVSKTKMGKLIASLVRHNQLTGWVSQRKEGFVPADQVKVKEPKSAKVVKVTKTLTKKATNKGGRPTLKQQIEREEREKALAEYRLKIRTQLRKQYGLD